MRTYEFKFIVDGSYQISSRYEIEESTDDSKGLVNVIRIYEAKNRILASEKSFTTVQSSQEDKIEWLEYRKPRKSAGLFSVFGMTAGQEGYASE